MSQTPLEYIASLRAQGHRDADIARALREAGWTRVQVRDLLRPLPPAPPPPGLRPPASPPAEPLPPPARARAAEPAPVVDPGRRNAWLGGVVLALFFGVMVLAFVTVHAHPRHVVWHPPPPPPPVASWAPSAVMPPPGGPPQGNANNWQRYFRVTGKYPQFNREPVPASSSGRIRASLTAEIPDEVWLDDRMTLSAHGAHYLDPELARLVHTGQATMKEEYWWYLDPAVTTDDSLRHHPVVTAWYNRQNESWGHDKQYPGLWVVYMVGVSLPDGSVEWARAETGKTPVVKRLHVLIRAPVVTPNMGPFPTQTGIPQGQPGKQYDFRAEVELLPSHKLLEGVRWEWDFDDGTTGNQSRVTHAFTRPDWYDVRVRAHWGGQVAEALVSCDLAARGQSRFSPQERTAREARRGQVSSTDAVSTPEDASRRCPPNMTHRSGQ